MVTRALIGALLLLVSGLATPAMSRAEDPAPVETNAASEQTAASEHFVVHYMSGGDPVRIAPVTAAMAQKVLGDAEAAHAFYLERGFPEPISDAVMPTLPGRRTIRFSTGMRWAPPWWDGKIDIYITRLGNALLGRAFSGSQAVTVSPGMFTVDYRAGSRTTAHELFHLIEFAIFRRATLDILLGEALANWGAYRFTEQGPAPAGSPGTVGPASLRTPWASLDCRANCGYANRRGGYDQWPFFQYLSERFGDGVIEEILNRSAALGAVDRKPHGFEAISGALAGHGSSLMRAFGDYTGARLDGSFKHPLLAGKTMTVNTKLVATQRQRRSVSLVVGHLAARAIVLRVRGGGRNCRPRKVKISIGGPAPSSSFVARLGTRSQQLAASGGRARLVTKLSTCGKLGTRLAVANLAPSGPDQVFTVSARVLRSSASR